MSSRVGPPPGPMPAAPHTTLRARSCRGPHVIVWPRARGHWPGHALAAGRPSPTHQPPRPPRHAVPGRHGRAGPSGIAPRCPVSRRAHSSPAPGAANTLPDPGAGCRAPCATHGCAHHPPPRTPPAAPRRPRHAPPPRPAPCPLPAGPRRPHMHASLVVGSPTAGLSRGRSGPSARDRVRARARASHSRARAGTGGLTRGMSWCSLSRSSRALYSDTRSLCVRCACFLAFSSRWG